MIPQTSVGMNNLPFVLQYCRKNLESVNVFVGFYNPPDSKGETLAIVIKDVFTRLMSPLEKLSGFSFDTAANMSGVHKGCQAWLKKFCLTALYVPCFSHSLDLILQEAASESAIVATILQFVKDASNVIRESSNRRKRYRSMFGESEVIKNLLSLCPTRWCIRASAIKRALQNYTELKDTLQALDEEKCACSNQSAATIHRLAKQCVKAEIYVGLAVCAEIFSACEAVATAFQDDQLTTFYGGLSAIRLLKTNLSHLRNEQLRVIINDSIKDATKLKLQAPVPKRTTMTPTRIRYDGESATDESPSSWCILRTSVISALDIIITQLDQRFDNRHFSSTANREQFFIKCAKCNVTDYTDLQHMKLPKTIIEDRLVVQLKQLLHYVKSENLVINCVQDLSKSFGNKDPTTRRLFSEVENLLQLILSLPCSVASSERSFSMLRRLQTWLRSSMSQSRLTHLAIMTVHRTLLQDVDTRETHVCVF